jgi:hypothetical protein
MAMFLSLDKFQTFSGLKSGGTTEHPDEGVRHFIPHILAMTSSSDALLDHFADYDVLAIRLQRTIVLVYAQHKHDHGCHLAS